MAEKQKLLDPAQVIRRRRSNLETKKGYVSLFFRVALLVLAGWILCTKVFLFAQASGSGMFPAVKDGDLMIGFRLQSEYAKNDVIVYTYAGQLCVGRIAAREGDVVNIDEAGTLYVNGTQQSGEILYPTYPRPAVTYPLTVPQGSVFVLGDYRTASEDSRDRGPIPMTQVQGKVITILRRRGL